MTFDLDLWHLTAWTYEGFHIRPISIIQVCFKSDFNFQMRPFFTFSACLYNLTSDDFWPWYMTFDCMNIWSFKYYFNKPGLVQIGLQLSNEAIFTLSYNLTSDDLWPWYMTFDLINKWGFPCCIYDPNLVEIHQSMRKITLFHNGRRQQGIKWSLCVFPAKAGDTKTVGLVAWNWATFHQSALFSSNLPVSCQFGEFWGIFNVQKHSFHQFQGL